MNWSKFQSSLIDANYLIAVQLAVNEWCTEMFSVSGSNGQHESLILKIAMRLNMCKWLSITFCLQVIYVRLARGFKSTAITRSQSPNLQSVYISEKTRHIRINLYAETESISMVILISDTHSNFEYFHILIRCVCL